MHPVITVVPAVMLPSGTMRRKPKHRPSAAPVPCGTTIREIWLPATLESVDMYAFKSEDTAVTISRVYYNGTKADWNRVYVSTQGDNDKYILPGKDTEWVYLKDDMRYCDVSEHA
ncbi:MAG: hypothetical protein IKT52_10855 [Oscillospiraceae bacterium]|nr:hypothetical protein [Oscillospiraceae bacterium]